MYNLLVVDDDVDILNINQIYFSNIGFNVYTSETAKDAMDIVESIVLDCIILDISLPDIDGYKMCNDIKEKVNIPIIFLSNYEHEEEKVRGFLAGGDDYITKPFRIRELISRIKAVLRRKGNTSEENKKILKFGDLSIYTLEARVYKNDKEIFLTSVEYKLLLILIQNKNTVLSRTQILEKLWDVTYDFVNDNTLTVYIKRLREKIGDDLCEPIYIETVRGIGYKWIGSENSVSI